MCARAFRSSALIVPFAVWRASAHAHFAHLWRLLFAGALFAYKHSGTHTHTHAQRDNLIVEKCEFHELLARISFEWHRSGRKIARYLVEHRQHFGALGARVVLKFSPIIRWTATSISCACRDDSAATQWSKTTATIRGQQQEIMINTECAYRLSRQRRNEKQQKMNG